MISENDDPLRTGAIYFFQRRSQSKEIKKLRPIIPPLPKALEDLLYPKQLVTEPQNNNQKVVNNNNNNVIALLPSSPVGRLLVHLANSVTDTKASSCIDIIKLQNILDLARQIDFASSNSSILNTSVTSSAEERECIGGNGLQMEFTNGSSNLSETPKHQTTQNTQSDDVSVLKSNEPRLREENSSMNAQADRSVRNRSASPLARNQQNQIYNNHDFSLGKRAYNEDSISASVAKRRITPVLCEPPATGSMIKPSPIYDNSSSLLNEEGRGMRHSLPSSSLSAVSGTPTPATPNSNSPPLSSRRKLPISDPSMTTDDYELWGARGKSLSARSGRIETHVHPRQAPNVPTSSPSSRRTGRRHVDPPVNGPMSVSMSDEWSVAEVDALFAARVAVPRRGTESWSKVTAMVARRTGGRLRSGESCREKWEAICAEDQHNVRDTSVELLGTDTALQMNHYFHLFFSPYMCAHESPHRYFFSVSIFVFNIPHVAGAYRLPQ